MKKRQLPLKRNDSISDQRKIKHSLSDPMLSCLRSYITFSICLPLIINLVTMIGNDITMSVYLSVYATCNCMFKILPRKANPDSIDKLLPENQFPSFPELCVKIIKIFCYRALDCFLNISFVKSQSQVGTSS